MSDINHPKTSSTINVITDGVLHTINKAKNMPYCKNWHKWACAMLTGIALPCSAIDLVNGYQVVVPQSSQTLTDSTTTGQNVTPGWTSEPTSLIKNEMNRGILGNIAVTPVGMHDDWCRLSAFPYVTLDGYKGYQVSTGVLVIPFGSMSARWGLSPMQIIGNQNSYRFSLTGTATSGSVSGSWGSNGNRTSGTAPTVAGCGVALSYQGAIPQGPQNPSWYGAGTQTGFQYGLTTTANIGYAVYVSPTAPAFRSKVDARVHRGENGTNSDDADIKVTLDLNLPASSCTVDTSDVVNFGSIEASNGQNPATVESQMSVTCTGRQGTGLPVSYSVTPKSGAGTKSTIPMRSAAGGVAGDIRGFMGQTASADAGCTDKPTSMALDGSVSSWGNVNFGERQSRPLAWTLCPRPNANPGPATATATLELTW